MSQSTEFENLPDSDKEQLVNASLEYMRHVTEIWGQDKGMDLWDKIVEAFGNDIKGEIFFGMVTGQYSLNGVLLSKVETKHLIDIIKALRTARTDLGLKEAKDLYDFVRDTGPKRIEVPYSARKKLVEDLRSFGCIVS